MRAGANDPFDPYGSETPEPSGFAVLVWSIVAAGALLLAVVALLYGVPELNASRSGPFEIDMTPTGSVDLEDGEIEIIAARPRADRIPDVVGGVPAAVLSHMEVENAGLRQTVDALRHQIDIMSERIARIENRFSELTGSIDPARMAAPPVRQITPPADARLGLDPAPESRPRQTPFGVELGAFEDLAGVRAAWRRFVTASPGLLADLEPVATVRDRGGQTELLLVAGPFQTAAEAAARCAAIEKADVACLPAFFVGQPLQIR